MIHDDPYKYMFPQPLGTDKRKNNSTNEAGAAIATTAYPESWCPVNPLLWDLRTGSDRLTSQNQGGSNVPIYFYSNNIWTSRHQLGPPWFWDMPSLSCCKISGQIFIKKEKQRRHWYTYKIINIHHAKFEEFSLVYPRMHEPSRANSLPAGYSQSWQSHDAGAARHRAT